MDPVIRQEAGDILESERFKRCRGIIHHKGTNVARHSLEVAEYALRLYKKGNYPDTNVRDVVRAGLLHDIGMSDSKVHDSVSFLKAYTHPRRSAQIAVEEYGANEVQTDAILHHMWPICVIPPSHRAGWLVLQADKHCAGRDAAGVICGIIKKKFGKK